MSATEIILERETANDESALIVRVFLESGSPVEVDTLLFETENSKATQEVRATRAGILTHALTAGQTVGFGVPIAHIGAPGEAAAQPSPATTLHVAPASATLASSAPASPERGTPQAAKTPVPVKTPVPAPVPVKTPVPAPVPVPAASPVYDATPGLGSASGLQSSPTPSLPAGGRSLSAPLISQAAARLLAEHGLSASEFDLDFITTDAVRAYLGGRTQAQDFAAIPAQSPAFPPVPDPSPAPASGTGSLAGVAAASGAIDAFPALSAGKPVAGRKRAEIQSLSKGAGNTMLSVLGVTIGPLEVAREPGDFLSGRITDLVLYEAARLLRKFPRLNAYFDDGRIVSHTAVHAGLAIDGGERLVVYGIEDADRVPLPALAETIADAVERYIENRLTSAEMTRATFTVTDLSGDELDFVFPLLPRGQTLILGVTRSAQAGFRIFAGFDHRVTEGREIGIFLGELRERLLSFATARPATTVPGAPAPAVENICGYCARSADEAVVRGKEKGLLKIVGRDGNEVLCCASCWNGW